MTKSVHIHMPTRAARAARLAASAAAISLSATAMLISSPAKAKAMLSPSAFHVANLCAAPQIDDASCLGLRLVAEHPESLRGSRHVASPASSLPGLRREIVTEKREYTEPWAGSLSPENVRIAYGLSNIPAPAARQTLAIVDAYDDPTVEQDLQVFDEQYDLPACTETDGCFAKVKMGSVPVNAGWAQEIATDVEISHSTCPECKILLVEATSNSDAALEAAENEAVTLGATEISNSWGGSEQGATETGAFNHSGVVITAATGDDGYLDWDAEKASERGYVDYPASSPHVVAVGGTRLELTKGGAWKEETVWNGDGAGGGGCSTVFDAPVWQQSLANWSAVGCGVHRAVADVSADADPYTGVAVYDSTWVKEGNVEYRGWVTIGGTSVASPIIAATFALAGGAGTNINGTTIAYPAQTLYENFAAAPSKLHDVTAGSNGACSKAFDKTTGVSACTVAEESSSCAGAAICLAGSGYDGPTGVGTPREIAAFRSPGEAIRLHNLEVNGSQEELEAAEKRQAEEQQQETKAEAERLQERAEAEAERKLQEERQAEAERLASEEEQRQAEAAQAHEQAAAETLAKEDEARRQTEATSKSSSGSSTGASLLTSPLTPTLPTHAPAPSLSGLTLTKTATIALARDHATPTASQIAIAFTLNTAAQVHITIARQTKIRGRTKWQTLPYALTVSAAAGHDTARLRARSRLAPGRYRLTVTPAGGKPRTLTFLVG